MHLKLSFFVFSALLICMSVTAQEWSREDSAWLKNVLEGKEVIKINDETKKAIEEGRLINPAWMRSDDVNWMKDLLRDFENAGERDSSWIHGIDPFSMPPDVFKLYILYFITVDSAYNIKSLFITEAMRKELEELTPTGRKQFYIKSRPADGFLMQGGINMDFNHLLSMAFSPKYRRMMKLRKHAAAYKNYYDDGQAAEHVRFTEQERKQLLQSIDSMRPSVEYFYEKTDNGKDD